MGLSLDCLLVANRCSCKRANFNEPNRVSLQALSQQLPRRLMERKRPFYTVLTARCKFC